MMRYFFVITCHNVFNMWSNTTLFLPLSPRDVKGGQPWESKVQGLVQIMPLVYYKILSM